MTIFFLSYFDEIALASLSILDINELNLPRTCTTSFPDPNDLLNFKLFICPDEGYYRGGKFQFSFKVSKQKIIL